MNIKRDDKVVVLSGKDKGKQGKVLVADPKNGKVIVEGINVATCHVKPRKQDEEGGIMEEMAVATVTPAELKTAIAENFYGSVSFAETVIQLEGGVVTAVTINYVP